MILQAVRDWIDPIKQDKELVKLEKLKLPEPFGHLPENGSVDPLFLIFQGFQALEAEIEGVSQLPLQREHTNGLCGEASYFCAGFLASLGGVPESNLCLHQLATLMVKRTTLVPNIAHAILYLRNAHELYGESEPFDVVYDASSSQFSGKNFGRENLYEYLVQHHGEFGRKMVSQLFLQGYIRIPHNAEGERKLGYLLAGYSPEWKNDAPPLPRSIFHRPTLKHPWKFRYETPEEYLRRRFLRSEKPLWDYVTMPKLKIALTTARKKRISEYTFGH